MKNLDECNHEGKLEFVGYQEARRSLMLLMNCSCCGTTIVVATIPQRKKDETGPIVYHSRPQRRLC